MRRGGIALLVLAVLAGIFHIGSPAGGSSSNYVPAALTLSRSGETGSGSRAQSSHTLGLQSKLADDLGLLVSGYWGPDWPAPNWCADIRFTVAFVPDPLHTHLSLFYDRTLEAIQEAAQTNGYDFDRAWMPWDFSTHPESYDFTMREAEEENTRERENLPGLMIFREGEGLLAKRDNAGCSQPLFVFVEGETPTGGINKEQFTNSLAVMKWLRMIEHPPASANLKQRPLLILGPTFSGSLFSLKEELDAILPRTAAEKSAKDWESALVYSGTVTSTSSRKWFIDQAGKMPSLVEFLSFQHDDDSTFKAFLSYAKRENLITCGLDVVMVSEEGTAFGDVHEQDQEKQKGQEQKGKEEPAEISDCAHTGPKTDSELVRTVYFLR
jgi:hypothetical protein